MNRKSHWEEIYRSKAHDTMSWFQHKPETSLNLIRSTGLSKRARIIDIGGGDSFLAENLLYMGYKDITVLDISEKALERARSRIGMRSKQIKWLVQDISEFTPQVKFDLWHDRAVFHFLTEEDEIEQYVKTANKYIVPGGHLIIGTFSEKGPTKCSGIQIKQYSTESLSNLFIPFFERIECLQIDHVTPLNKIQNFTFCRFRKYDSKE